MKLRNKKTGEINNFDLELKSEVADHIKLIKTGLNYMQVQNDEEYIRYYNSLAELNEDWEDYNPTEPLIKDEKIRKALRAWAEAIEVNEVVISYSSHDLLKILDAHAESGIRFDCEIGYTYDEGTYTIAELCGEEEE